MIKVECVGVEYIHIFKNSICLERFVYLGLPSLTICLPVCLYVDFLSIICLIYLCVLVHNKIRNYFYNFELNEKTITYKFKYLCIIRNCMYVYKNIWG